jgi:hypothetical protein
VEHITREILEVGHGRVFRKNEICVWDDAKRFLGAHVFGLGLSISFCAKTGSQAEQDVGDESAFRHLSKEH